MSLYYSEIFGIHGDRGSGKSILMTYLGLQKYRYGFQLYSNYKLNFPRFKNTLEPLPLTFKNIMKFDITKGVILIDEADQYADSHHMNKASTLLTYFLKQSRKIENDLIFSSILYKDIDVRIRKITNYDIFARVEPNPKHPMWFIYRVLSKSHYPYETYLYFPWVSHLFRFGKPDCWFNTKDTFNIWETEQERKEILAKIKAEVKVPA